MNLFGVDEEGIEEEEMKEEEGEGTKCFSYLQKEIIFVKFFLSKRNDSTFYFG